MNKLELAIEEYLNMPWHYCTEASIWEGQKGYWISVAELPDCSTFSTTIEEGLSIMPLLLREYIKAALIAKSILPLPKAAKDNNLSGKLLLRLPPSLHLGIKNAAKLENLSINQFALKALTEAVTKNAHPIGQRVSESSEKYDPSSRLRKKTTKVKPKIQNEKFSK
jgi:predicted RNase H-like HicB family nuclease